MDRPDIRNVKPTEVARAESVHTMAFSSDPIMRWLWPEPHEYLRNFPRLVRGFGGGAFDHDAAHVTHDFVGGTLWLPPGVTPDDEALEKLMKETVAEPARSECGSILEQMGAAHPKDAHWHLAFIGVDPAQHGRGIGAALLRHTLALVDAQHLHAYLESSNPANDRRYTSVGFVPHGEFRYPGGGPVVTTMWRPAR